MARSLRPEAVLLIAVLALPSPARAQSLDSLVTRLGQMSAITGMEDAMADTLLTLLPGAARDRAGNVVLTRGSGAPTRIVACGMDETGYVVGSVTDEGYLSLRRVGNAPIGPLYDQFLEGQRVTVFGRHGPVPGVVGVKSTHLTRGRAGDDDPVFALDNAYVDVGASSAADLDRLGIQVLAPVTRAKQVRTYGPDRRLVSGVAIAQRAGCAALVAAAKQAQPASGTMIAAFTARWNFTLDGLQYLVVNHPGAEVTLVGAQREAAPTSSGDQGNVLSAVMVPRLRAATGNATTEDLPVKYWFTPAETVSMTDVRALAATLVNKLEGR